ncbi:WAT1-related protein [Dendrobium catenatum]|uniref:WAT1-related protein n=1 Tax=Dendrobium catenatum TaxID=906689 RepID=A0A2I0W544_9ASPA|nr:WAT1-related protein [Dendrobium catenatum]
MIVHFDFVMLVASYQDLPALPFVLRHREVMSYDVVRARALAVFAGGNRSNGGLKVLQEVKPYLYMVLQQFFIAVMYVLAEATLKDGMNQYVLVVYRNIIAAVTIAPFAFCPVLQQNFFYMGAKLTSASFAAALENIIPAITYIMALVLRLEKLEIKQKFGQARVIGTVANVAGAILMIIYKGPNLKLPWYSGRKDVQYSSTEDSMAGGTGGSQWIEGTFSIIGSSTLWSAFLILQSNTLKSFPTELTLTALICLIGAVMSAVVALVLEDGSASPWIIGVVMNEKGPVFVGAFIPLCFFFTMALGSFFLSEKISLGMAIGSIIMVAGLYALLWGNSKDQLSQQNVRDPGEQELSFSTATLVDVELSPVAGFLLDVGLLPFARLLSDFCLILLPDIGPSPIAIFLPDTELPPIAGFLPNAGLPPIARFLSDAGLLPIAGLPTFVVSLLRSF